MQSSYPGICILLGIQGDTCGIACGTMHFSLVLTYRYQFANEKLGQALSSHGDQIE